MSDFSSAPHDSTASVNEGLLMFNEMGIRPSSKLNDRYGSAQQFQQAISELKRMLSSPDSVTTDSDQLSAHGHSFYDCHPTLPPSVVVFPRSTGDVVAIVKIANKYKMPVIPYSGATSLDGQFRATSVGGISVDMSKMNKILEVHASDSDLVCQPGAKWVMINESLKTDGIPLFFPLDPGLGATIGGMISTGCSGTNAVRYGTAKGEWILNVTVVLPNGEVLKTRRRSRKCAAGFDTTKLFIGAEGTLGIITEATIRLAPLLQTTVAVIQFPDVRKATEAVIEIMNKAVGIQCIELCDNSYMRVINESGRSGRQWPVLDTLLFKFQGPTPRAIEESAEIAREIAGKYGGTGFEMAQSEKEAEAVWEFRKNGPLWALEMIPGSRAWSTDVCVPVMNLPQLIYETKKDINDCGIPTMIVGHVGDGNFHAVLYWRNDQEKDICAELVHRMNERAIALDGTCTGEHGVGMGKRKYLIDELGEGTVELMKTIKRAIDPYNLFNPGKLYPDDKDASVLA